MNGSVIFTMMSLHLDQEEKFDKVRNHFTKNTCSSLCSVEMRSLSLNSEEHNSCMAGKDNKQTPTAAGPQGRVIQGLLSSSYRGQVGQFPITITYRGLIILTLI